MGMKIVPGRELSESCHSPTQDLPSLFPSRLDFFTGIHFTQPAKNYNPQDGYCAGFADHHL